MNILLHQEKFHRVILKAYRVKKMVREEQTIRTLLTYYQSLACAKYPTEALFEEALAEAYHAQFKVQLLTYGTYSVIEYSLSCIDPKWIDDENYRMDLLFQLFEEALIPAVNLHSCKKKLFAKAVEYYESDLWYREDQHQLKAIRKAIQIYFKNTARDFDPYGNLKELKTIDERQLYNYYQTVLKEEFLSIGSTSLPSLFDPKNLTFSPKKDYYFKERNPHVKDVHLKVSCKQCYLEVFYELNIFTNDELYYPAVFLNYILGGSASSKLFLLVREKYGLCYSISSIYLGASGIIIVSAILDEQKIPKALSRIEEAVETIGKGEYDLEEVKRYYLSIHQANEDFQETQISNYLTDHYFLDTPASDQETDALNAVKKEDIRKVFEQMKRTFTLTYGGKK